ncbi:MAG: hypothetical protein DRG82_02795 [Deltaproteobacteria bacterium]|nr:MAG: hypothetical protein DRG82_02795 [Deltaproteobacteria bacterium]
MATEAEFLCIGVTGHRPDGLKGADWKLLRARVREMFSLTCEGSRRGERVRIKGLGQSVSPLRVISPLAEGADQIIAEEGLSAGGELYCPLPFKQEEYERDFSTPESLDRFRHLLSKASLVNVLGGKTDSKAERDASYASAGREVLRRSDILLAVWDGNPAKGTGGTAQIVEEAKQAGIPVVWIDSRTPHRIEILVPQRPWKKRRNKTLVEEWVRCLAGEEKKKM